MKLPRIVNGKFISILAILIGIVWYFPDNPADYQFNARDILNGILWIVAAIFTWNEKVWAAILLAILTFMDLIITIIPAMKDFDNTVQEMATVFPSLSKSTITNMYYVEFSIGILAILLILYYVVMILWNNREPSIR